MRKCVVAAFVLFAALVTAYDAEPWPAHGLVTNPAVVCNFITGIATGSSDAGTCIALPSVCDGGTTNNTAAWDAFITWAVGTTANAAGNQIELFIPAGYVCKYDFLTATHNTMLQGIKKPLVVGYGSTLTGQMPHMGGFTVYQDAQHTVRINATAVGDTQVTINPAALTQPSNGCQTIGAGTAIANCAVIFSVGQWIVIGSVDQQSGVGLPPNSGFFDIVQIASVNSTSGVITLNQPIANAHKATYPAYIGHNPGFDTGGPATVWALPPEWNVDIEWRGLTIADVTTQYPQIDLAGRHVVLRDINCLIHNQNGTGSCFAPTMSLETEFFNVGTPNSTMEPDKQIKLWTVNNSHGLNMQFQSAGAIKNVVINNSTYVGINGSPSNLTLNNDIITASISPGASGFGNSKTLTVINSNVADLSAAGNDAPSTLLYEGKNSEGLNNAPGWSMTSGGVITVPNAYVTALEGGAGWMTPGTNGCWADANTTCAIQFQITDLTQDGNVAGVPTLSTVGGLGTPIVVTLAGHGLSAGEVVTLSASFFGSSPLVNITNAIWSSTAGGQYDFTVDTDLTAKISAGSPVNIRSVVSTFALNPNSTWPVISVSSTHIVVTAAAGSNAGTYTSGGTVDGCTLPGPLVCSDYTTAQGQLYFVSGSGLTANTFQVAATSGGASINAASSGVGPFGLVYGNTYVHTNAPSCAMACWTYANSKLFFRVHPAPYTTFSNNTGGLDVIGRNGAPVGSPLYSYFNTTLTCAETLNPPGPQSWSVWGLLQTIDASVSTPYGGALTATIDVSPLVNQFFSSTYSTVTYIPAVINTKQGTTTRSLDATSGSYPQTWTGGQSGDTLTTLTQALTATGSWRNIGGDISSDCPPNGSNNMSMNVTVTTKQNVVNGP